MMNMWTTRMGYPYLSVTSEAFDDASASVTLSLKQQWFLADGSVTAEEAQDPARPVWHIPLLFATAGSVSDKASVMTDEEQSFAVALSGSAAGGNADDFVKINAGQKALVRVNYSAAMLQRMAPFIAAGDKLSAVDTASLLLDSYALLKAGLCPVGNVIAVLKAIDTSRAGYIVWSAIAGVFTGLYTVLEEIGGDTYANFLAFAKHKVTEAVSVIGWDNRPSDEHTDKLLRTCVIGLLDKFAYDDAAVVAECRARFDRHFDEPAALPSEYVVTVYSIVLMNGGAKEYEAILKKYYATEDNQQRKDVFNSLGATLDIALKTRCLDWAVKSGDVKLPNFFYPIASGTHTHCHRI